ncbi:hypothetical protein W97_02099 [Coniosporium apollinis CBS 100218]|uniref:SWR1-complex protein 4 n=1 Tax=Coniosporium apollinis (strain CBS 100218) TaxID=1168221 RepID=R7YM23_CONA1|nr:uncharacterized protein W97_02099 [Coniosporium apollinis CBS 100218]EON62874.1 hypothetical protein W97_02099 [Coniosporium apollinis CBS 100218]
MASRRDVDDILGLDAALKPVPPPQRQKTVQKTQQRRKGGIARELADLHGDRDQAPVVIQDESKAYRGKKLIDKKPVQRWAWTPFVNSARSDGLVLRHWKKAKVSHKPLEGSEDTKENFASTEPEVEEDSAFAKYNVQIETPQYTDEQYEAHLRNDDWSKEETDYLCQQVKAYYQRWPVIADRYDFQPSEPSQEAEPPDAAATPPKTLKRRSMEDLKQRYYQLSAICMTLQTPVSRMNPSEFSLHETLSKFSAAHETTRKKYAESLLRRSADEIKEEEFLLAELQRIALNYKKLETERQEIRQRLEGPQTSGNTSVAQYSTSPGLQLLFTQLITADRAKKRGRLSLNMGDMIGTPNGAQTPVSGGGPGHRDSISVAAGSAQQKKGSAPQAAAATPTNGPAKQLSPRQAARFGYSTHERLTSGVTFRLDKLLKIRQAKSTIQTQKIAAALAELKVPELLPLPTERACDALERLVGTIVKLLDVRKVLEKEEAELRIAEETQKALEGGPGGQALQAGEEQSEAVDPGEGEEGADGAAATAGGANGEADADGDEDVKMEEASSGAIRPPSSGAGQAGHKRSASVMSSASNKSNKRPRK